MKDSSNRKYIKIRGANEHNLKNVSLDIDVYKRQGYDYLIRKKYY